jgi:hypothetical protein
MERAAWLEEREKEKGECESEGLCAFISIDYVVWAMVTDMHYARA